jgi:ribulose-5-phosphate 4-epimerase/fuculose-1-phosphate aldolase
LFMDHARLTARYRATIGISVRRGPPSKAASASLQEAFQPRATKPQARPELTMPVQIVTSCFRVLITLCQISPNCSRHYALGEPMKQSACLGLIVTVMIVAGQNAAAQTAPASGGPVDRALIEDLVAASHILAKQGVLDAFGHVSVRNPNNPNRYLMSRAVAPELTTANDVIEYDLDSNPVNANGRASFIERFIHGEIYKTRPDVSAIVHSHSPTVIPFTVSQVPLRAILAPAGFLVAGVPVFEIRNVAGMTNMLVSNNIIGKGLAETLGDKPVALMRGHGDVVVGASIPIVTFRAIYTEIDARLQWQAIGIGGPITFLEKEEGDKIDALNNDPKNPAAGIMRPWELWKKQATEK